MDPENISFAQKVHAGYQSCLRDSVGTIRSTDIYAQSCFETCQRFSIGLDTALFGQDHVLACSVRFAFDNRLEQFPLFFSVCDASTGQNLASFIFTRLKQINAPFSKLVSLSTDGASNMVGRFNGLFQCFKTLVQQEHGTIPCAISQVWCLAHRLNLVIRDFPDVKNINSVFISVIGLLRKERLFLIASFCGKNTRRGGSRKSQNRLRRGGLFTKTSWRVFSVNREKSKRF